MGKYVCNMFQRNYLSTSSGLKKNAPGTFETFAPIYEITWSHIPENCNIKATYACHYNLFRSIKKVKVKVKFTL